jgi:hypothetical protein
MASKKVSTKVSKHVTTVAPVSADATTTTAGDVAGVAPQPVVVTGAAAGGSGASVVPSGTVSVTYVPEVTTHLASAEKAMPPPLGLTAYDKIHDGKARKGGERYMTQLIALARQHGLDTPLAPLATMESQIAAVQQLVPLEKQSARVHKQIGDRLFAYQSASWSSATDLYAVLTRFGTKNGDIADGLKPIAKFFKSRNPAVKKPKETKAEKEQASLAKSDAKVPKAPESPEANGAGAQPETTVVPSGATNGGANAPTSVNGATNGATHS